MDGNPGINPSFPTEDLLIEILLWLPVVSLLRFKAVCRRWRSVIESSDFIHRHATFRNSTTYAQILRGGVWMPISTVILIKTILKIKVDILMAVTILSERIFAETK
ncbi:hypothetical protein C5167_026221 [Papaver somniferum]|nr:hypothetical protein C5167_026221 [Papaver somniferum]